MKCLVLLEYDDLALKKTSLCAIQCAQQISDEVDLLLAGQCAAEIITQATQYGAQKVWVAPADIFSHGNAETIAALIADIAKDYTHVLAAATSYGKNILPRAAALLDVAQLSDIVEVKSADTFIRPIYAGNALATVQSRDPIKVMTVRYTAFAPAVRGEASAQVETLSKEFAPRQAEYVGESLNTSLRPELTAARVVISGGRALQSAENFKKLLDPLADKLKAAIGASRAAVDAGYIDNDAQVGQTGKIVAPELYVAIGISGAIQHLAGMKDSKIIVAINKDPAAEIMQIADYALQADLFTAVPELIEKL